MTTAPIEMSIQGMTCGHCAMTVRKALRATLRAMRRSIRAISSFGAPRI